MDSFYKIVSLQVNLFLLIGIGFVLAKIGMLKGQGRKTLSDLLLNVIFPASILNAFLNGPEVGEGFGLTAGALILISALIQLLSQVFNKIAFRSFGKDQYPVAAYGMLCSNSTFIGYPFAQALYGSVGIMLTSVFQIPIHITVWSVGQALFTKTNRGDMVKKLLLNPCILAVVLGMAAMLLKVTLPEPLRNTISSVSGCTTPISLFVVGAILADASLKSLFSLRVLWFSLLRLAVFPAMVYLGLKLFSPEPVVLGISVLMSAMPAGSTASILADKYGGDADLASRITFTSTLCAMLTVPLWTLVL